MVRKHIFIPIKPGSNLTVDWGDGSPLETFTGDGSEGFPDAVRDASITEEGQLGVVDPYDFMVGDLPYHRYLDNKVYQIKLYGRISGFWATRMDNPLSAYMLDVKQWGDLVVEQFGEQEDVEYSLIEPAGFFARQKKLHISAPDAPKINPNTSFDNLFLKCDSFNSDISHWDTTNVVSMVQTLMGAENFNQDLSPLPVPNVAKYDDFAQDSELFVNQDKWPRFDRGDALVLVVKANGNGRVVIPIDIHGNQPNRNIDWWPEGQVYNIRVDWGDGNSQVFSTAVGDSSGYDSGYGSGYDDGYGSGYDSGYGSGYDDGYGSGYDSGYGSGYNLDAEYIRHVYDQPDGIYVVTITGDIPGWIESEYRQNASMYRVLSWGSHRINYEYMFCNEQYLVELPQTPPTFEPGSSVISMFENTQVFNQDLSNWDVQNVVDFSYMFSGAASFYQDLSTWTTGETWVGDSVFLNSPMETETDFHFG